MYVTDSAPVAAMVVHDGSAVMVVGQVAVLLDELLEELLEELLDELLDELLGDTEFEVENTLLLVLLRDSELLEVELGDVTEGTVGMLLAGLVKLGETADVAKTLEVELVTVFESTFDVELKDTLGGWMLETVVGVVSGTVTRA